MSTPSARVSVPHHRRQQRRADSGRFAALTDVGAALGVVVAAVIAGASLGACTDPAECHSDADCATGACSAGSCVVCNGTKGCGDGEFCCLGQCHPESDIQSHCGCSAELLGSGGQSCSNVEPEGLCLVAGHTASTVDVAAGTCGCGCTPATGGPLCVAPENPGDAAVCSCGGDNAACKRASEDAAGHPHRAADTCTPTDTCVCLSASTADLHVCDPDGATPDCTLGGCVSLVTDVDNCGVPGKVCSDEATGVAGTGVCVGGGCSCNAASDCSAGGNVDSCVFPTQGDPSCVCAAYRRAGIQAPCPMALDCAQNGCILDGTAFTSEESLLSALGLPPAP